MLVFPLLQVLQPPLATKCALRIQDKYGGWLRDQSVPDFAAYAAACFTAFGDRAKHWTTFNEMASFIPGGWMLGVDPPSAFLRPENGQLLVWWQSG